MEDADIIHRKDGKPHKLITDMGKKALKTLKYDELNRDIDGRGKIYTRLCKLCHKGVHWAMDKLNLSWDEIQKLRIGYDVYSTMLE